MMKTRITDRRKDPLGAMLKDYFEGDLNAYIEVESNTLDMSSMSGEMMFRGYQQMSLLEQRALELCEGHILDVGGGSGCHSLWLQERGKSVISLDISPGCVEVMKRRGVQQVLHQNVFNLTGKKFETILLLMNGIGMSGNLIGLDELLAHMYDLLAEGGQILTDSTDLAPLMREAELDEWTTEGYFGETEFVMSYGETVSVPFSWLYIDYETLCLYACRNGFTCELIEHQDNGQYLARLCTEYI